MSLRITFHPISRMLAILCSLLASVVIMPVITSAASAGQGAQAVEKRVDVGGYNLNFRIIPGEDHDPF